MNDIDDPLMQKTRYLNKQLVDELTKGKARENILKSPIAG
ncbi:DUF2200 family protein [Roseateles sp.]